MAMSAIKAFMNATGSIKNDQTLGKVTLLLVYLTKVRQSLSNTWEKIGQSQIVKLSHIHPQLAAFL